MAGVEGFPRGRSANDHGSAAVFVLGAAAATSRRDIASIPDLTVTPTRDAAWRAPAQANGIELSSQAVLILGKGETP